MVMGIKAVGFDFFGTLVGVEGDWKACTSFMCSHLHECGYEFSDDSFISNYRAVVAEFRKVRYEDLREINNSVWVADTLKRMGHTVEPSDPDIISAVEKYFEPWQVKAAPDACLVLEELKEKFTISLVSNFTDEVFLQKSLRKIGIEQFFHNIIVSNTVGWRKPHPEIFKRFLEQSEARAEEAVFIGDDLKADIKGAKAMGIKTVWLVKPDADIDLKEESLVIPDHIVNTLSEFKAILLSNRL